MVELGKQYVAPEDGWFKPGTYVTLVGDCGFAGGMFEGIRIPQNPYEIEVHGLEEYMDSELCPWEEFGIITE